MAMILNHELLAGLDKYPHDYKTACPDVCDPPDWEGYSHWFLGREDTAPSDSEEAWAYPIGDGKTVSAELVHRSLVLAKANNVPEIVVAAEEILNDVGYVAMLQDGNSAEFLIYGDIGGWDEESVQAMAVIQELRASTVSEIHVRINSFGGAVSDGLAIYNALRRHSAKIVTHIDGVAASIASLIAMAGDTIMASASSMLMIHAPWTMAMGGANDLREMADVLDVFSMAMAAAYAPRIGKKEALGLLKDVTDHWYAPSEALSAGLIDNIETGKGKKASASSEAVVLAAATKRYPSIKHKVAASGRDRTAPKGDDMKDDELQLKIEAEKRVAAQLLERNAIVAKICAPFLSNAHVREKYEAFIIDPTADVDTFQRSVLAELGRDTAPVGGTTVLPGEDGVDKFRTGAAAALAFRAGVGEEDTGSEFRGSTLVDLARASLRNRNVVTGGLDKMAIVAAAFTHTDSDFPLLLSDVANKSIMKGWDLQPETFTEWTASGSLSDFKVSQRMDLNLFPALTEVPDGAEYTYGTIGEHGETVQLATYGKLFSITRKAIINDDLDAFGRIPRRMGRAAKRTIGNLVYAILTGNPALSDGVALFDAAHKNVLVAAALNTASLDKARVAMQTQKDPDGFTTLNIRPAFLLVPAEIGRAHV